MIKKLFLILVIFGGLILGSSYPYPKSALAQGGDPVFVGAGDIATCGRDQDEATAKLLDNISGTVFTLGDNVYPDGTVAEFADCYAPSWGRHKDRTRPVPGNHDYHTAGAAGYFGYFGAAAGDSSKGYYSYNLGAWHIIALNSEIDQSAGSAQEKWLRADLAANQSVCTLAYWHKPRFSSGRHGNNSGAQAFWQALYDFGADVVLNGHDHTYERFAPQNPKGQADPKGIREFIVGTGGAGLYPFPAIQPNSEIRNNSTHGVLKLTLHATSYDWQFVPIAGQNFTDSGRANCVGAGGTMPTTTPTSKSIIASTPTFTPSPTMTSIPNVTSTQPPMSTPTQVGVSTPTVANTSTPLPIASGSPMPTATLPSMTQPVTSDLIVADSFESGNFSGWSSSTTDGGDLSVGPAAALSGSNGLQTRIDDTNPIYVTDDSPAAEQHYRVRFYFDPNSIKMASGDSFAIFNGFTGTSPEVLRVGFMWSSGKYQLRGRLLDDGGAWLNTDWFPISDASHVVELDWWAATAKGANDGGLTLWIDGTQQASITGVDNDTRRMDRIRLGAVAGIDAGTAGTVYFDAFESRRQTYIGPVGNTPPQLPSATAIQPTSPAAATQIPVVTATATNVSISTPSPVPNPSDLVFADNFDSGNLSAWTSNSTDNGDLSVSAAAALSGGNGLQTLIDDNNPIFVRDDSPNAEPRYRVKFYFDPNSIQMANGDAYAIFVGSTSKPTEVLRVGFQRASGNYQLRARLLTDRSAWLNTNWFTISDNSHIIELDWRAARAAGANDGGLTLWIDGTQQADLTGVDNDTRRIDSVQLGAPTGLDSGTRGTVYFDAFESRRQTISAPTATPSNPMATPTSTGIPILPTAITEIPTYTAIPPSGSAPIAWVEDAMIWVFKNDPVKTNPSITLYSAKNEYEPFQIVVRAPSANDLSDVNVSVSDLVGPNGSTIGSENITLYREHYVYVTQGSKHNSSETNKPLGPGWYPDALIPFKNPDTGQDLVGTLDAVPFSVEANQNQPIWVDVYTPANTPAGTYQGTATITSAQGNVTVKIVLNVWNFALPQGKALQGSMMTWNFKNTKTDTEILKHGSNPKHVVRTDERSLMEGYGLGELAVFRVSGANRNSCTSDPAPSVSEVATEVTRHQSGLYLYDSYANEVWDCTMLTSTFLEWAKNLRAGGIHPMIVTYPTDALMGPDINNTAADIWAILPRHFDVAKMNIDKLINHQGTEVWSYNPLVQDGYSPKFTVDFLPINFRIMQGFINQSMGLRGTKFWRIDYWSSDPWNNVEPARPDTPGDGLMVYRGDEVGLPGQIVPGFRLKLYREGAEDFEYVEILKKMGQGGFAINTVRTVATDFHTWSQDKNALYAARKILGDKIQSLSGVSLVP